MGTQEFQTMAAFQPTLPARGATGKEELYHRLKTISTHAPRTGSDIPDITTVLAKVISTHAPRTGSDTRGRVRALPHFSISTHAPRTGSDRAK